MESHKKLFRKLLRSLRKLVSLLGNICFLSVGFELPASCDYWKLPVVQKFVSEFASIEHHVDGCMIGVTNSDGQPLKKSWRIMSNFSMHEQLEGLRCDKNHVHGESRGTDLKNAESYTHVLTDAIHVAWRKHASAEATTEHVRHANCAVVQQVSETGCKASNSYLRAICAATGNRWPVIDSLVSSRTMSDSAFHRNNFTESIDRVQPRNDIGSFWRGMIAAVGAQAELNESGIHENEQHALIDMYREVQPQMMLDGALGDRRSSLPALIALNGIDNDVLSSMLPGGTQGQIDKPRYLILVSDSTLTLLSGGKRRPKHGNALADFNAQLTNPFGGPLGTYLQVQHHDLWGAKLIHLVGKVEQLLDTLVEAAGSAIQCDVVVVWSSNELVGPEGVFTDPSPWNRELYPGETWDEVHGARGNIRDIASGVRRALRLLGEIRSRPNVGFVSLACAPEAKLYSMPEQFNDLTAYFASEARRQGVHTFSLSRLIERVEMRDHYHMEDTPRNRALVSEFLKHEVQILLAERYCGQFLSDLERIAGRFPYRELQFPRGGEPTAVNGAFRDSITHAKNCRSEAKKVPAPPPVDREAIINKQSGVLNAIEEFVRSRMPTDPLPPLPAHIADMAPMVQTTSGTYVDASTDPDAAADADVPNARGDPLPEVDPIVPINVDTHLHVYADTGLIEEMYGSLPEFPEGTPMIEAPQHMWPTFKCRRLELPELKRVSGACRRSHSRAGQIPMDEEGWLDVMQLVDWLNRNSRHGDWDLSCLLNVFKNDRKSRFIIKGVPCDQAQALGLPVWPCKIRSNQGFTQAAVNENPELEASIAITFFDPRTRDEAGDDATREGKPVECRGEYPTRLYHRTGRTAAYAIIREGLKVAGGERSATSKAHIYFADKTLDDLQYKSGVRANKDFEIVVDTSIALMFGAEFFRTGSDGILTRQAVSPKAILSVRDTKNDAAIWSIQPQVMFELQNMLSSTPYSSYGPDLTMTLTSAALGNQPPAKVARVETSASSSKPKPPVLKPTMPTPKPAAVTIPKAFIPVPGVTPREPAGPPPKAKVAVDVPKAKIIDLPKAKITADEPKAKIVKAPVKLGAVPLGSAPPKTSSPPAKALSFGPSERQTIAEKATMQPPPKAKAGGNPVPAATPRSMPKKAGAKLPEATIPESAASSSSSAATEAFLRPEVTPQFVTYPCPECQAEYYVGQHICFVCEKRLRPLSGMVERARKAINASRHSVLRELCTSQGLRLADLDIEAFKMAGDTEGKVVKSPEAEALTKARNHLDRAKQLQYGSIFARFKMDAQFAANILYDGQTASNVKIWDCLAEAVIFNPPRTFAQRALNLGAYQTPMGEDEKYPARAVFFGPVPGETLRSAKLIKNESDPPVCIGFGGTFFSIDDFAHMLRGSPHVVNTLLTFRGYWRIPQVFDANVFSVELKRWFQEDMQNMIAIRYNQREEALAQSVAAKARAKSRGKGRGSR